MTDRVAGALDRLSQISAYDTLEDRVFCHPATGGPYDASQMRKRLPAHLKLEKGGNPSPRIHFHDDTDGPTGKVYVGWLGPHRDNKSKN